MSMAALAEFGEVNRTGFRKALKKHDKARPCARFKTGLHATCLDRGSISEILQLAPVLVPAGCTVLSNGRSCAG